MFKHSVAFNERARSTAVCSRDRTVGWYCCLAATQIACKRYFIDACKRAYLAKGG